MEEKKGQAAKNEDLIIGRNAVAEALRSGRSIDSLLVARGDRSGSIGKIIAECREKGVVIKQVDEKKLDCMCSGGNHQGVAAWAAAHEYASLDDIFALADKRGEKPFIIICDELYDPRNLGAIIRTADAAGAHGVIVPKRRSASLSYAVSKTACGALEYVPVARVGNLPSALDELKEKGLWIYGADIEGEAWCGADFSSGVGLVIGSEGKGLGKLIRQKCDFTVSLPMKGNITSLNASVAAGIIMYEVARQRSEIKAR